jgi:hypothetical protein
MGFRFQRRIRVLPGLRLNVSKSGVSASVGGRGAWFTLGPRGSRATVGMPGTGISYTHQLKARPSPIGTMALYPADYGRDGGTGYLSSINRSLEESQAGQPTVPVEPGSVAAFPVVSRRGTILAALIIVALVGVLVALH